MNALKLNKKNCSVISLLLLAGAAALTVTIANLFVILLFLCLLISYGPRFLLEGFKNDWLLKIFSFYLVWVILTIFRENHLSQFTPILLEKRILMLLPFAFYIVSLSDEHKRRITQLFIISVTVAALISLVLTFQKGYIIEGFYQFSWYLSVSTIFSSNYLALFIGFSLILLFDSFFNEPLFTITLSAILFAFLLCFLTVLGSRLPYFSAVFLMLGYLILKQKNTLRSVAILVVSLITIGLMIEMVPYFKNRIIVLFTVGFIADARYYEYQAVWSLLKHHLYLGLGFTGADTAMAEEFARIGFQEGVANRYNAHNQFLQAALIGGIPGVLITFALYVGCFIRAIQIREYIGIAFVVFFTLCSMTESLLERNKGILFLSLFAGLLLMRRSSKKNAAKWE